MKTDRQLQVFNSKETTLEENANTLENKFLDGKEQFVRQSWNNKLEFLLAAVGYAVGLGNVWRFPWLLVRNGGGAFLIPYFVMLLAEGIPLFYMEVAVGQKYHLGPVPLWRKVSPYSSGIGVSQVFLILLTQGLYLLVIGWAFYYLFASFRTILPWSTCPSISPTLEGSNKTVCSATGPTVYFWYHEALDISSGLNEESGMVLNWKMTLSLLLTVVVISLCLIKGVKSTGKVVYFTALFPYVVLVILLVRGLTLEGYDEGLKALFSVDFAKLSSPLVWLQAAVQIFYSLSLGSGGMVTYGSYNPTHQEILTNVCIISVINSLTSLLAGIAVYSLLGHRAFLLNQDCLKMRNSMLAEITHKANNTLYALYHPSNMNATEVHNIQQQLYWNVSSGFTVPDCSIERIVRESPSGSGLAFFALTEVLNKLPGSHFFSIMFFLMIITIGLDSSFGGVEAVVSSIRDTKIFKKYRQEFIVVVVMVIIFLPGLLFVTSSGEYFLQLVNTFAVDLPYGFIAFAEVASIAYLYGLSRFCNEISLMTGRKVGLVWKILWGFVSPAILLALAIVSIVQFSTQDGSRYQVWNRKAGRLQDDFFPAWGIALGWFLLLLQIVWLPCFGVFYLAKRKLRGRSFDVLKRTESQGKHTSLDEIKELSKKDNHTLK